MGALAAAAGQIVRQIRPGAEHAGVLLDESRLARQIHTVGPASGVGQIIAEAAAVVEAVMGAREDDDAGVVAGARRAFGIPYAGFRTGPVVQLAT